MKLKIFVRQTFGITFPMTEKINVIGNNSHPFYKWAKKTMVSVQYQNGIFIRL